MFSIPGPFSTLTVVLSKEKLASSEVKGVWLSVSIFLNIPTQLCQNSPLGRLKGVHVVQRCTKTDLTIHHVCAILGRSYPGMADFKDEKNI